MIPNKYISQAILISVIEFLIMTDNRYKSDCVLLLSFIKVILFIYNVANVE